MALQSNTEGWINGVIGTVVSCVIAGLAAVTRQTYTNKSGLEVVKARQDNFEKTINKMDKNIDRIIDHLIKED